MGTEVPNIPSPIDNPTVWCERCQKRHRKYTFTGEDVRRYFSEAADKLADSIDAAAIKKFYEGK